MSTKLLSLAAAVFAAISTHFRGATLPIPIAVLAAAVFAAMSLHAETFTASGPGNFEVRPFAGDHTFQLTGVAAANNVNWFVNGNHVKNSPAGTPARLNRSLPVGTSNIEARNRRPNGNVVGVTRWAAHVPNRPPVVQIPTVTSISPTVAFVRVSASDPDGHSVQLVWSLRAVNGTVVQSRTVNQATATIELPLPRAFIGRLVVHAVDALGQRSADVSVPIVAPNARPKLDIVSATPIRNGAMVRVKAEDPDQSPRGMTGSWRWTTNGWATFRAGGSLGALANRLHDLRLTGLPGGVLAELEITVTDGSDSATARTKVRTQNTPPSAPAVVIDSEQTRSNRLSLLVTPGVDPFDVVNTTVSVRARSGVVFERTFAGTNQGTFHVNALLPNNEYTVTARTTDGAGVSSMMAQARGRTLPMSLPPNQLVLSAVSPDRIQVTGRASGSPFVSGFVVYDDGSNAQQDWILSDHPVQPGERFTFDTETVALRPGTSGTVVLFGHTGRVSSPQRNLSAQSTIRFQTLPAPQGALTMSEETEFLRFEGVADAPWASSPVYLQLEDLEPVVGPLDIDKGGLDIGSYTIHAFIEDVFGKSWRFATSTFEVVDPTELPEAPGDEPSGVDPELPPEEPLSPPPGLLELRVMTVGGSGWVWVADHEAVNEAGDRYFIAPSEVTLYPTPDEGFRVESVRLNGTLLTADEWGGFTFTIVSQVNQLEVRFTPTAP